VSHSLRLAFLALLTTSCATASGALRFENRDPVWQVADRDPIPKPEKREHYVTDLMLNLFRAPMIDGLNFPGFVRAKNINSLGEVPSSSWWTNRIGVRAMSAAEVARGPRVGERPTLPFTILEGKPGGSAPGFIIEDARGVRYILKLDRVDAAEVESSADVVVARFLWALGYNVPDDQVVHFAREDLVLCEDATIEEGRDEIPLTNDRVDEILAKGTGLNEDGRWRALLSRFVEGIPIGGYPFMGTRHDDPNDRVDHEHRRDLRAAGVFFAWLDQTDTKEANTLDSWIPSREEAELGYVRHYMIDFGKALGAAGIHNRRPHAGWSHHWDYGYAGASLLTFGLWVKPWENREMPGFRGIGRYAVEGYEPDRWSPLQRWIPMRRLDRFDAFWASKLLMRFEREHVEAVVAEAQLSDPAASRYLVDTLLGRQRKTARRWFQGVAPLDGFSVAAEESGTFRVCATDLWRYYDFGDEPVHAMLRSYDRDGAPAGWQREGSVGERGRICGEGLEPASGTDEYTVVRFDLRRGDEELPAALLHLARNPEGELRVIGLHRM
jgi:hypothetical protein